MHNYGTRFVNYISNKKIVEKILYYLTDSTFNSGPNNNNNIRLNNGQIMTITLQSE